MQTSADGLNGEHKVSHMTDEKGETWSPFGTPTPHYYILRKIQ